jgi:hypothetical protein
MGGTKEGRKVTSSVEDAYDLYTTGRYPIEKEITAELERA